MQAGKLRVGKACGQRGNAENGICACVLVLIYLRPMK